MQHPDLPTLAARFEWARRQQKLTQDQLAERTGHTREAITAIEAGRTQRPRRINELAAALNVSPAWLQFGVEELDELPEEAIKLALAWHQLDEDDPRKAPIRDMLLPQDTDSAEDNNS